MKNNFLNGNWEVSYKGMRIEISSDKILFLWRNSAVLDTKFTLIEHDDSFELRLKDTSLRYSPNGPAYAEINSLTYRKDELLMTQFFPITGESKEVLHRTDNSRYGNYDIADELLDQAQGVWCDEDARFKFEIKGSTLIMGDFKINVHILRSKNGNGYKIVDQDPEKMDNIGFFTAFEYYGDYIKTYIIILDASSEKVIFKKIK